MVEFNFGENLELRLLSCLKSGRLCISVFVRVNLMIREELKVVGVEVGFCFVSYCDVIFIVCM